VHFQAFAYVRGVAQHTNGFGLLPRGLRCVKRWVVVEISGQGSWKLWLHGWPFGNPIGEIVCSPPWAEKKSWWHPPEAKGFYNFNYIGVMQLRCTSLKRGRKQVILEVKTPSSASASFPSISHAAEVQCGWSPVKPISAGTELIEKYQIPCLTLELL
jgi:hypothetical protein